MIAKHRRINPGRAAYPEADLAEAGIGTARYLLSRPE